MTRLHSILFKLSVYLVAMFLGGRGAQSAEPASGPAQATALKAHYRSGQTFITWQALADPAIRYRIYRSAKPIADPSALSAGQRVGEVSAGTSLNLSASIDLISIKQAQRKDRNYQYEIPKRYYYVIDEKAGPLSPTTGLFVYTAKADGPAYYAVTAVKDGTESTQLVAGETGNALGTPVEEKVAFPGAVVQRHEKNYTDYVHWTDNVGTKEYPPMGSLPSTAYNFRVFVPDLKGQLPLILFLHGSGMQFLKAGNYGIDEKQALYIALDSPTTPPGIKDAPNNPYPFNQGWYGHNENAGTGKPESEGRVQPYTVNRVVWMIDWAAHNFEVNTQRVGLRGASMGSVGTFQVGLLHPDRFAALNPMVPIVSSGGGRRSSSATTPNAQAGAPGTSRPSRRSEASDESSSLPSFSMNPASYAASHPEIEFPPILLTAGRTDYVTGWKSKVPFVKALEPLHTGIILYWDLRGHFGNKFTGTPPVNLKTEPVVWNRSGNGGVPTMPMQSFALNQSYLAVANLSVDDDPGTVDFAVPDNQRPAWDTPGAGDFIGTLNGAATWDRDTLLDKDDRYEITMRLLDFAKKASATADITPRRVQNFHPAPGAIVHYSIVGLVAPKELAAGDVKVDANGHVTIEKAPITKAGTRLVIQK